MRYTVALFDMDGTINKTDEGVINGFRHALAALGYEFPEDKDRRLFMGPPIEYSFEKFCGLDPELMDRAVEIYRQYYSETGINECELYPGLVELFKRLKAAGVKLLTASSKPEYFVRQILRDFEIDGYFDYAAGGLPDLGLCGKTDVINHALAEVGVEDRSQCLMIGDRFYDIDGGKEARMDTCGILWGYGTEEELRNAGADYIAATPREVGDIICG